MNSRLNIVLFAFAFNGLLSFYSYAQSPQKPYKNAQFTERILESANAWNTAKNNKDYYTQAKYTYRKLISSHGNVEKWISDHQKAVVRIEEKNAAGGFSTSKRNLIFDQTGKMYHAGEEIYCVVPFSDVLKVRDRNYISYCSLVAISADKGETWTFAEVTFMKDEHLDKFFPSFDKNVIRHKPKQGRYEEVPE